MQKSLTISPIDIVDMTNVILNTFHLYKVSVQLVPTTNNM